MAIKNLRELIQSDVSACRGIKVHYHDFYLFKKFKLDTSLKKGKETLKDVNQFMRGYYLPAA